MHQHPLTSEEGGLDVLLRNVGDTPVTNLSVVDHVLIEEPNEIPDAVNLSSDRPLLVGTLQPGSTYTADVRFKTTTQGMKDVVAGRVNVVNLVKIAFEDAIHRRYTVSACDYWDGGMAEPQPCQQRITPE